MIIGISGKIGSGKDTVGQIIQYLVWNKDHNVPDISINDYLNGVEDYYEADVVGDIDYKISKVSGWEVKKFADKLKDMVCLLIGCTREKLENRDFKEAPLSEDWTIWHLYVDGTRWSTKVYLNESDLDEAIADLNQSQEDYNNMVKEKYKQWKEFKAVSEILTPRKILQLLGTDCGRDLIHPNIWVNSLMADYYSKSKTLSAVTEDLSRTFEKIPESNWLITDTRFPNEAEAVLEKEGILIRVNRGDGNTGDHPSETALDNFDKFTYVIDNNGTMEELIEEVRKILITEKLI